MTDGGSLDATGTVATIYAGLLAGKCLRPQRQGGGEVPARQLRAVIWGGGGSSKVTEI